MKIEAELVSEEVDQREFAAKTADAITEQTFGPAPERKNKPPVGTIRKEKIYAQPGKIGRVPPLKLRKKLLEKKLAARKNGR